MYKTSQMYDSPYININHGEAPPPPQTLITDFPIGDLVGQQPSVYVRDITNGIDLYEHNADVISEYPASCVKLMTLLLAYEAKSAVWTSEAVTITAADVVPPISGSSAAGFADGDITTWEELAYGLLLPSGFDACLAIERLIGGDFIALMNARAAQLGMTNTIFTDSYGGSKTFNPTVVRNTMSARDLGKLVKQTFSNTALRTIAQAITHTLTVTGLNPREIEWENFSRFINGPTAVQAGIRDVNILGSKNGVWDLRPFDPIHQYNIATLWKTPTNKEVVIVTMGSGELFGAMLDQRGIMHSIPRDFPYLAVGTNFQDSNIANVKLLIGADGSITDESPAAKTLTNASVTVGNPVIKSTGGMLFNAASDNITVADAADITVGSGDMTIEEWITGTGGQPGGEAIFFCKADGSGKEWLLEYFNGNISLFISADGSNWISTSVINGLILNTFFNGAPRHIALVKEGSIWSVYLGCERMVNTLSAASAFNSTAPLTIGYLPSGVSFIGKVDEFRATFGIARYTAGQLRFNGQKFPRT